MPSFFKGFRVELDPNNYQKTLLKTNVGCARYAFNWALQKTQDAFNKKDKLPSYVELSRQFTELKNTNELSWAYNEGISSHSFQNGLMNFNTALHNFYQARKKNKKAGFPKLKSKRNGKQSFKLNGDIRLINQKYIKLPRIGKIKLKEIGYIPDGKINSATVNCKHGKWFVSCLIEIDIKPSPLPSGIIGVDLGIKLLATCSDGKTYENPRPLEKNLKKLKIKQRQLSKKIKGSKNREKAKQKLAKLHYRVYNIRKDTLHKVTSKIIKENQIIILEDLNVSNMIKNSDLSRSINDIGIYEFRRQIEYKAKWNNRKVVFVDRFYPSSKLCSYCDWKNENLTLSDRIFKCKQCNNSIDRDLNAAKNLEKFYRESPSRIDASGDGSSSSESLVSLSLKEESNMKQGNYASKV